MTSVRQGHCACGAPATHHFAEGKNRSRAITRACCECFEREMTRVAGLAGACQCGHPDLLHDEGGCRLPWCPCETERKYETPPPGPPGRG